MKKYLLTIMALFSVIAVANDDFKASVTAAYGTRHLSTKEEKKMQFQYSLI